MFRQTFMGGILAILTAATGTQFNAVMYPPKPAVVQDDKLADSLAQLSTTLVSFESRQTGSERNLASQLESLAVIVGDTQKANQAQIDALSSSLGEVKRVAQQESDAFKSILQDFASGLEKKFVKAQADDELPAEGVSTLNVNDAPESSDRPQDFAEAARRIVELEKAVKELQSRSVASVAPASSAITYTPSYPAYASSAVSYGSTGSSYSGGSTGSRVYQSPVVVQSSGYTNYASTTPTYTPVYSYAATPAAYAQPRTVVQRRGIIRSSTVATNGTCRVVNGRVVCP